MILCIVSIESNAKTIADQAHFTVPVVWTSWCWYYSSLGFVWIL